MMEMGMRILLINATYEIGSTGRNCKEILDELERQGEQGYIAFSQGKLPNNGYCIGGKLEKKLHALLSRVLGLQGYFSTHGTRKFLKYLDAVQPDIIHINNVHANFLNLNMLYDYIQKKRIPVVMNLHDCWSYTGKCCHYTQVGCDRWQSGCHDCPKLKQENVSWFFDRTLKMWKDKRDNYEKIPSLYVVGVSDWITNEAQKSILKSAKRLVRIYNWVDLECIPSVKQMDCKKEKGVEGKFVILGVASRWDESKGLSRFIELTDLLDDDSRIVLIGAHDGKEEKNSKIIWIPPVLEMEELMRYYIMADAFVTMSYEESFGKVSAEALACGTPVVCFDSTANAEVVGSGCGHVVKKGDMEGLYAALEKIRRQGKEYYSESCRQYAADNFNRSRNVNQYIKLYKEIIEEKQHEK